MNLICFKTENTSYTDVYQNSEIERIIIQADRK